MPKRELDADLRERLLGSLLFDPEEKREILDGWSGYGTGTRETLKQSLDREDELLEEAMKKNGPRITALVESYVQELNAQAYHARKAALVSREADVRKNEIGDADRVLQELTA